MITRHGIVFRYISIYFWMSHITSGLLKISLQKLGFIEGYAYYTKTSPVLSRLASNSTNFMFKFPCIISLYYIKNQQDATLAVLFTSNCKITLRVSDAFCVNQCISSKDVQGRLPTT